MKLQFISGNRHKFEELRAVLPDLEMKSIDLPEIQEIDPRMIIKAKLLEARKHTAEAIIVEDTSLYFEAMNGSLPGPLIKWFVQSLGSEGLANMAIQLGNSKALAKTVIGYSPYGEEMHFFEGVIKGDIVMPVVESAFGWDPIFQPQGYDQTFAEMGTEKKNQISQRRLAAEALKSFLDQKN